MLWVQVHSKCMCANKFSVWKTLNPITKNTFSKISKKNRIHHSRMKHSLRIHCDDSHLLLSEKTVVQMPTYNESQLLNIHLRIPKDKANSSKTICYVYDYIKKVSSAQTHSLINRLKQLCIMLLETFLFNINCDFDIHNIANVFWPLYDLTIL